MLLTREELKEQTRELWRSCFHESEDFMDIYFEEKYRDEYNLTASPDGSVAAALQLFPYRMTVYGLPHRAGYISGLATAEAYRKKGLAAQLLRVAHRRLFQEGATLSLLIPGSEDLRHFYEEQRHGAYWTATYRSEIELEMDGPTDLSVTITQPDYWGDDLYVFYKYHSSRHGFMVHPAEHDFYAALAVCDAEGGAVLVARKKRKIVGICLAAKEADGRCIVRSMLVNHLHVKNAFVDFLSQHFQVEKVYGRIPVAGSGKNVQPYAMARVINVERFLRSILAIYPDFQLHIGVDGDLDIPENNGYYRLDKGRLEITDEVPDSIVTPGGLAAMFLASHPTTVEMMLDE